MAIAIHPVADVTRYLRDLIEQDDHLRDIWVAGEVSNLTLHSSGHIYFTLKDAGSSMRCAFFRNRNNGQRNRLANGGAVVVHGSLSVYEPRGEVSFIVDFVQPEGIGALAAEFERRRALFEEEGLFAAERKRPLPPFPRAIGVVTSPTGAVRHDIADVLERRWPLATILLQPAPVQGPGAADLVAAAIRALAARRPDVIIVARGGGSAEDLWAFNEEPVVRAIFASPVPIISAVGHETDFTLADFVADMRAPTPSAAAEIVAPDCVAVQHRVDTLRAHASDLLRRRIAAVLDAVRARRAALARATPEIAGRRERIRQWSTALRHAARVHHDRRVSHLERTVARLATLSPLATLQRGYAVIEGADGTPVTSAQSLRPHDAVVLRLHDGMRHARVEDGTA